MKKSRTKRSVMIIFPMMLSVSAILVACSQPCLTGSRAANQNSYTLDIERMTGNDTHAFEVSAGDSLKIRFATEEGSMQMEIRAPDGTILYSGNGKGATDFTVNISEGGVYAVAVKAHGAKGMIHIQAIRRNDYENTGVQK